MELQVSKEITYKWQNQRSVRNKYVSWALFLKLQTAEINFEKLLGWTVFKPPGGTRYNLGWEGAARPLFKTKITDFPTLFKTEFQFLIPCLKHLCIGQIEASTSLPIWLFWKLLFKFPPTRAKTPFKCPTLGSIQVIKCPHPRDISQAHKWQKDGGNTLSCRTKSLKIQQIIRIQYNKN